LAIRAENGPGPVNANPAGLNAGLEIEFAAGRTLTIATDAEWRVARDEAPNWYASAFDDHLWMPVAVLGKYGCAPWGKIANQPAAAPLAAGEVGGARVFYLIAPRPILLRQLRSETAYRLSYFDPVEGRETESV